MAENAQTLAEVLNKIDTLPWDYALFLPIKKPWDANAACLILDPDESEDPQEDPDTARRLGLTYALGVHDVQDIVANAKEQVPDIDAAGLIKALNFYYAHDAFIEF